MGLIGIMSQASASNTAGTISNMAAIYAAPTFVGIGGTVTNAYACNLTASYSNGTVNNQWGLYIGNVIYGSVSNYGIQIAALSKSGATTNAAIATGNVSGATNNYQLNLGTGVSVLADTTAGTSGGAGALVLSAGGCYVYGASYFAGTVTFGASPIAPTPTLGDSSTKVATTAFVAGTNQQFCRVLPSNYEVLTNCSIVTVGPIDFNGYLLTIDSGAIVGFV